MPTANQTLRVTEERLLPKEYPETISYKKKLEKLLSDNPNDQFYKGCMGMVDNLTDCQKAWINRYYYDDPELSNIWLREDAYHRRNLELIIQGMINQQGQ